MFNVVQSKTYYGTVENAFNYLRFQLKSFKLNLIIFPILKIYRYGWDAEDEKTFIKVARK